MFIEHKSLDTSTISRYKRSGYNDEAEWKNSLNRSPEPRIFFHVYPWNFLRNLISPELFKELFLQRKWLIQLYNTPKLAFSYILTVPTYFLLKSKINREHVTLINKQWIEYTKNTFHFERIRTNCIIYNIM